MIKLRPWEKPGKVWRVWRPDESATEDDAREVEAFDAAQAAEDYAEWDDSQNADYAIVNGSGALISVRGPDGSLATFKVTGEAVPQYTARETE